MKRIILNMFAAVMLTLVPATPLLATAHAADCGTASDSKGQVLQGIGETGSDCNDKGVKDLLKAVVNILSIIVGIAAIIVIIISGMKYVTSAGDTAKISSAKSTLIYALIGLAIAALAQFLVHFVLTASSDAVNKKTSSIELNLPQA